MTRDYKAPPRTLELDGVTRTVSEWALSVNLSVDVLRMRLARGTDLRTALLMTGKEASETRGHHKMVTWLGKTQNLKAWAAELGLSPLTVYKRSSRGLPIERVLAPTRRKEGT